MRNALIAAVVGLIVVMIFIIQNPHSVDISFLGVQLRLPLAVARFGAAIAGALLIGRGGNLPDHPAPPDRAARPEEGQGQLTRSARPPGSRP